ncbi:MAG: low molecular weight protein-tyrosine-phosphatase [Candidatus Arcticimaribacter sp.]
MVPGNVLMVCLGNICRSPLAHGIFQDLAADHNIKVDSAGTANYHTGAAPDPRSIEIAAKKGIDISPQQARQFEVEDFDQFDYIYVMDKSNLQNVLQLARTEEDHAKVRLLLGNAEVEDPYYGGKEGFSIVFDKIQKACQHILDQWKN